MVTQAYLFRGTAFKIHRLDPCFRHTRIMKDSSAWSDLLQDPTTIRAQQCNNSEQIEAANDIIQQSPSQMYDALHDRAKLLATSGQFEAALRDAVAMQKIQPTAALGYLCEGDVYCQQGRSEDAMATYSKGLEAVPASDPHYHDLQQQQQRITANTTSNKRIDFISELPIDVVSTHIIPKFMSTLLSTGCCPYLHVSHTWQQLILQHAEDLSVEVDYEAPLFHKGHGQLIRFAPYVKSLDLTVSKEEHLVDLLSRAKFSSLEKLKLESETTESQLKGLAMVADTLTHLDIGFNASLHLYDVMQTCRNLTFLKFQDVDAVIPPSPSSLQYPRLTHLGFHSYSEESVEEDNLVRVLSLFPNLVSLAISPMPEDSSILPLLTQQCPHLRMLSYGPEMEVDRPIIHVEGKGITVARFGEGDMFYQDDLMTFLSQHHQTLQELDLHIFIDADSHCSSPWTWTDDRKLIHDGKVVPMSLPNLQTLRITEDDDAAAPCLEWIMENAPQLQSITIPESLFLTDTTALGLKQLKHLKKLHVKDASGVTEDGGVITPLLQHHAALGDRSTLEHIQVNFATYELSEVTWLPFVCGLKQLKKLALFTDFRMGGDCIPFLKKLGKGCPALDNLMLGYGDFEDGLITALGTHPNLKSLYIGAHSLSEHELRSLANFPKLERVYIRFPPPDSLANYLPKRIQLIY
ncbi:predicted protein [Lichtheimia corymbifera JMRC:FSU:9682]|uniref:Uncharacterized protein n=1 Tax=Lichtheimia corymbifera JMRC:FSU:9682 TaxID=1263082 RepID=A0A068SI09_9FUNG|nr:predicted protein [Lichtheimia corymbifera JMRC:FSU:9682]